MENKKVITSILLSILCLALLSIPLTYAVSTEINCLRMDGFSKNQGKYLEVGSFKVFACDKNITMFDSSGVLQKTYDLVFSPSLWSGGFISTSIIYLNSSHLILGCEFKDGGSPSNSHMRVGYLSVDTLTYTPIVSYDNGLGSVYINGDGFLVSINGVIYFLYNQYASTSGFSFWLMPQIYPTYSADTDLLANATGDYWISSNSIWIPSETTNELYVISQAVSGTNRYSVWKINVVSQTVSKIGDSAIDNTYGDYVYYYGHSYDTDGASSWYDVGIVYNNPSVNKEMFVNVARFNDTFVDVAYRSTLDEFSSAVNVLRCLSVPYYNIRDNSTVLAEGNYSFVYVGAAYALYYSNFTVSDLNTDTPSCSISSSSETYQSLTHYYTAAASVGGYIPTESNLFLEIDYTNKKAVVNVVTSPEITWTYTYSFDPNVTDSGGIIILNQSRNYVYTSHLLANGVSDTDGYYKRYVSYNGSAYQLSGTGALIDGELKFSFNEGNSEFWWKLEITVTNYGNSVYTKYHQILATSYIPGSINPGDSSAALNYGMTLAINFLIPLLLVGAPAMILGAAIGMPGIFIGLMLGMGVGGISGIVPIWMVVFLAAAMFIALFLGGGSMLGRGNKE